MKLPDIFHHYIGVCVVLIVAYFCLIAPFTRMYETTHASGSQVSVTQPVPANKTTQAIEVLAQALKDKALADAVAGHAADLSASQQTIAKEIQSATGLNAQLAAALAEGLTRPSPKVQVITVATKPTAGTSTTAVTNDAIQADMATVLNDPKTKVHVDTNVTVSWQDKPMSPFFAAYATRGAGVGYAFKQTKYLNADLLFLTSKYGQQAGAGVDHVFKGTSASVGVAGLYNFQSHHVDPSVFVGIHF